MRALRQKAGSQRGASITFALLLFLVCAVISSVVIVAATAAAGRMSQQADMDERYYAVTAAARKLITELDGKEVTLQYPETNPEDATATSNGTNVSDKLLGIISKEVLQKKDTTDSTPFITIPTQTSGSTNTNSDDSSSSTPVDDTPPAAESDQVEGENTGEETSTDEGKVTCTITKKVTAGGLLEFDICASGGKMSKGTYNLKVTFSSNLRLRSSEVNNPTKSATVTWKFLSMRKMRADYKAS